MGTIGPTGGSSASAGGGTSLHDQIMQMPQFLTITD